LILDLRHSVQDPANELKTAVGAGDVNAAIAQAFQHGAQSCRTLDGRSPALPLVVPLPGDLIQQLIGNHGSWDLAGVHDLRRHRG